MSRQSNLAPLPVRKQPAPEMGLPTLPTGSNHMRVKSRASVGSEAMAMLRYEHDGRRMSQVVGSEWTTEETEVQKGGLLRDFFGPIQGTHFPYKNKYVIHPNSVAAAIIFLTSGVLLIYSAIQLPLDIGFSWNQSLCDINRKLLQFNIFVDTFFCFEIFVTFFVGVLHEGSYVEDLPTIAWLYVKSRFAFDCLTSLPTSWVEFAALSECGDDGEAGSDAVLESFRFFRLLKPLRLVKLLRFFKFAKIFTILDGFLRISPNTIRLAKLLFGLCLLVNLVACIYWLIKSSFDDGFDEYLVSNGVDPNSMTDKWILAVYFINTVFTTVGFGDIDGDNEIERAFCIVIMWVGTGIFATLVNGLQEVGMELNEKNREKKQYVQKVVRWLRKKKCPVWVEHEVAAWLRFKFDHDKASSERTEVLEVLPPQLQLSMVMHLNGMLINQAWVFGQLEHAEAGRMLQELALITRFELYNADELIASHEIPCDRLCMIWNGVVSVQVYEEGVGSRQVAVLRKGESFGELSLLGDTSWGTTYGEEVEFWAPELTELAVIQVSDFVKVMKHFPRQLYEELKGLVYAPMGGDMARLRMEQRFQHNRQRTAAGAAPADDAEAPPAVWVARWERVIVKAMRRLRQEASHRMASVLANFSAPRNLPPPAALHDCSQRTGSGGSVGSVRWSDQDGDSRHVQRRMPNGNGDATDNDDDDEEEEEEEGGAVRGAGVMQSVLELLGEVPAATTPKRVDNGLVTHDGFERDDITRLASGGTDGSFSSRRDANFIPSFKRTLPSAPIHEHDDDDDDDDDDDEMPEVVPETPEEVDDITRLQSMPPDKDKARARRHRSEATVTGQRYQSSAPDSSFQPIPPDNLKHAAPIPVVSTGKAREGHGPGVSALSSMSSTRSTGSHLHSLASKGYTSIPAHAQLDSFAVKGYTSIPAERVLTDSTRRRHQQLEPSHHRNGPVKPASDRDAQHSATGTNGGRHRSGRAVTQPNGHGSLGGLAAPPAQVESNRAPEPPARQPHNALPKYHSRDTQSQSGSMSLRESPESERGTRVRDRDRDQRESRDRPSRGSAPDSPDRSSERGSPDVRHRDPRRESRDHEARDSARESPDVKSRDSARESRDHHSRGSARESPDRKGFNSARDSPDVRHRDSARESQDHHSHGSARESPDRKGRDSKSARDSLDVRHRDPRRESRDHEARDSARESPDVKSRDSARESRDHHSRGSARESPDRKSPDMKGRPSDSDIAGEAPNVKSRDSERESRDRKGRDSARESPDVKGRNSEGDSRDRRRHDSARESPDHKGRDSKSARDSPDVRHRDPRRESRDHEARDSARESPDVKSRDSARESRDHHSRGSARESRDRKERASARLGGAEDTKGRSPVRELRDRESRDRDRESRDRGRESRDFRRSEVSRQ